VKKLTDAAAAKVAAKNGKRTDYPDGLIAGLMLRVSPDGSRSFSLTYRVKGDPRKRRLTLGSYPVLKLGEARDQARDALLEAKAGKDPATERRAANSRAPDTVENVVDDFVKRYLQAKGRAPSYVRNVCRTFEIHVIPKWRGRDLKSITRRDVVELLDPIMDQGLPIAANKTLAALRKLFAWALSRDIIDASPVAGIEPPGEEKRRERVLSDDELRELWPQFGALGYPWVQFFQMALATGQRRSEVAGIRWEDIDETEKNWTLPSELTKPGRTHVVPLSALALEILAECRREALARWEKLGAYVFTTTRDRPISGYSKTKAGLDRSVAAARKMDDLKDFEPWTIHDLRRTVGTGLGKLGISRFHIARVLNHADSSVTGIYDRHEYLPEKRHALDVWARYLGDLVDPPADKIVTMQRNAR
jgi:integrase